VLDEQLRPTHIVKYYFILTNPDSKIYIYKPEDDEPCPYHKCGAVGQFSKIVHQKTGVMVSVIVLKDLYLSIQEAVEDGHDKALRRQRVQAWD